MSASMHLPVDPARRAFINARLVDPASGYEGPGGVLIENGLIRAAGPEVTADAVGDAALVDCRGLILLPGLIDMRVFTGEPGYEHRETLRTASLAAAAGGVTSMIVMPDTDPVIDDAALVDFILRRARDTAIVRVAPMAAITRGLKGETMSEIGLLREAGAVALTDGRRGVASARVLRRAMAYARDFDMLICQHVEDADLAAGGVMHEGELAARLGLPGIPPQAEVIMLERDIRLVELTGARYHAMQISCAESVEVIRRAKARGLPVSCGVSINHLLLNEHDIGAWRTFFKLSPPLRSEADRQALVAGLADGTIDVIVSSHDPQGADSKRLPFAEAAFGAIGLQTLLSAALSLYHAGAISLLRLSEVTSRAPARLLGIEGGTLAAGALADFVLVDPEASWRVTPESLLSSAKNTPFEDRVFEGRVVRTVVAGRTVFSLDSVENGQTAFS
ncbi:dihydroorotase [Thermopetrobacter sp. TC1]|uniref:dihydroorotase n=1 Tax=Thermopetrobacter sp. TC1 TaxID=1495045 RepID=UPI0009E09805|nr:dihydroorotase [Thermopetrobacter sp. TC1]